MIDVATAISGSGAAYYFLFTEALCEAGAALGLDPATAVKLARLTLIGAAGIADQQSTPLAELRRQITSPGGTTEAALTVLSDQNALASLVLKCAFAAANRGKELSLLS